MRRSIRQIVKEEIRRIIQETDAAGVMQGGGDNPSAGTYETPLGSVQRRSIYKPTEKRSHDFSNGSMMCQHSSDENNGTINKKRPSK